MKQRKKPKLVYCAEDSTTSSSSDLNVVENMSGSFDLLPDDLVISIGLWVASSGSNHFVRFQKTCHRLKSLLERQEVLDSAIKEKGAASYGVTTLEQLGLFEALAQFDFLEENRVGFDFASIETDHNDGKASGIQRSRTRVESIRHILKQFSNSSVKVAAHCGIAAPPTIAHRFSRARGRVVMEELRDEEEDNDEGDNEEGRVELEAWGLFVAEAAAESDHPFGAHARTGKGWVDVFVRLGELELPPRPAYYEGLSVDEEEEELREDRIFRFFFN
jgi:hypothetical protein